MSIKRNSMVLLTKYPTWTAFVVLIIVLIIYSAKNSNNCKDVNEQVDVVYTWVNGSDVEFIESLNKYLVRNFSAARDYSSQRYDDKYELKFSLRSLEKYAPWIRHVYIVTNGQIPYWLNLDYSKVTLVSHKDIFVNLADLPTFSSPAIESHLHRIPGLSDRFIYFNDDVLLGSDIYIDDFISLTRGYLIYLAWPLPMCAEDCSWIYVGDGQCDSACLNLNCQMDGGDCNFSNKIKNSWDENFSNFVYSNEVNFNYIRNNQSFFKFNTYQNEKPNISYKSNSSNNFILNYLRNHTKNHNLRNHTKNHNLRKFKNHTTILNRNEVAILNNSKVGLAKELRIRKRSFLLYGNETKNLTKVVRQHNLSILLNNKLKRRKKQKGKLRKFEKPPKPNVDIYGASLQFTNRKYNIQYGFKSRYVPAHAPIMIEKKIMQDLQLKFAREFQRTSTNKIRSEDDMQFSFSYYYFLINEKNSMSISDIFDRFDTDNSGTWSDREIRTILTKLYDLPLSYATVDHFEELLLNCSKIQTTWGVSTPEYERYIDSKLPTVTKSLVINCHLLSSILLHQFGSTPKYKYEIIDNSQNTYATFKMLTSNVSEVVGHLDEIRRSTKKFVCLNDNMDESRVDENELIRAVLYDFYVSMFPKPSKFELPADYRNRFLYIDELNAWKSYHFKLKMCTYFCVTFLCYFTYRNLLKRRFVYRFINKLFC